MLNYVQDVRISACFFNLLGSLTIGELLISLPFRTAPKRGYHGGHGKQPTMNDMPQPEGDFFALHAKRQARNNRALLIGIATLSGTLFMAKESKLIYFNYNPPKSID